jgi:hypothetical protein
MEDTDFAADKKYQITEDCYVERNSEQKIIYA